MKGLDELTPEQKRATALLVGEEIALCIHALGTTSQFLSPRDGPKQATQASLCAKLKSILDNPGKEHPFAKPRVMPWLKEL